MPPHRRQREIDDDDDADEPAPKRQRLDYAPTTELPVIEGYVFRWTTRLMGKRVGASLTHPCCIPCAFADGTKRQANFPDEDGRPKRLCADHARAAGTYQVRNPCRDCPVDGKFQANFPDEDGRPGRLCAAHAREAGTYQVLNPCRDCPVDGKLSANFPDEDGRLNQLCAAHAEAVGSHVRAGAGASKIADECLTRIERVLGITIGHRVRLRSVFNNQTLKFETRQEGQEKRGLVPGSMIRPDGYEDEAKVVWLFHGNRWHGFPPDHPSFEDSDDLGPLCERYWATLTTHNMYTAAGYTVKYVWEHEYKETLRARCPRPIQDVIRIAE